MRRVFAAARMALDNIRSVGFDRMEMAILYRGWQLDHLLRLRSAASTPSAPGPAYIRCSCGWEGRAHGEDQITMAALDHLGDVIKTVDGTRMPHIEKWPPGITGESRLEDLSRVLQLEHRDAQ